MSEMINWVKDVSSECESVEVSELNTWFSELQTAYQQETNPSLAVRKQRLQALKTQLTRYQSVLAEAMSDDFGGRSHTESLMADVLAPILDINHVNRHLKSWMKSKSRPTEWLFKGNKLQVRYQPKGVVGIILSLELSALSFYWPDDYCVGSR